MTAPNIGSASILRTRVPLTQTLLQLLATLGLAALVLAALLILTGHEPVRAFTALWNGAFGSPYQLFSVTLVRAIPLALTGLAVAIAFRAGILNIGAEGQLLAGAAAATAIAATLRDTAAISGVAISPVLAIPLMLIAGTTAGATMALVAAWLRQAFGVLEVISTIMLNFVALNLVGYLVRGPLQEPLGIYPQSPALPVSLQLPTIPGTRLHAGLLIVIAAAALLYWWTSSTASGFRARAVGANPFAAASAGRINVARVSFGVFLLSGALAGIAGAVEYTGVTYALYQDLSPGYGYTAIAVALLARLNIPAVLLSALLFGALDAGASAMQRDANVPNVLVNVINALLILFVLVGEQLSQRHNAAERGT